jgi:hypothetical protein
MNQVGMAISFDDQVAAFLAVTTNQAQFAATTGLAAFATTSFTQKYGQGGFQLSTVTLGAPSTFRVQEVFNSERRFSGFREKRSEQPQRHWYDLRVSREAPVWVDAVVTMPIQFAIQPVPGSLQLGPSGGLVQAGVSDPALLTHSLQFQMPVATSALTVTFQAQCLVFVTADPSPVTDLRRIISVRRIVENDGQFLASLDGTDEQTPYLFVQLYPAGVLAATPLSQAAVVATFAASDVLAVFLTVPNL